MQRTSDAIFDADGTLRDVRAAASRDVPRRGANGQAISADWRTKQIEYGWMRSLTGATHHRDFWRPREAALAWTAARHRVSERVILTNLLPAERRLDAFADAAPALTGVRNASVSRAILSAGLRVTA
jgi:2-haloacid dehalogenase